MVATILFEFLEFELLVEDVDFLTVEAGLCLFLDVVKIFSYPLNNQLLFVLDLGIVLDDACESRSVFSNQPV